MRTQTGHESIHCVVLYHWRSWFLYCIGCVGIGQYCWRFFADPWYCAAIWCIASVAEYTQWALKARHAKKCNVGLVKLMQGKTSALFWDGLTFECGYVWLFLILCSVSSVDVNIFFFFWIDNDCSFGTWTFDSLRWWGSSRWCLLGTFLSLWGESRKYSSYYWSWFLLSTCCTSTVRDETSPMPLMCPIFWELVFVFHCTFLMNIKIILFFNVVLFSHPSPSLLVPAIKTVGNIVSGDDFQTQVSLVLKNAVYYFRSVFLHWNGRILESPKSHAAMRIK